MTLTVLIVSCLLLGLAVGSFLNVVIYRVPRGESIVAPGSHCPACGVPIRGRDNIPILSWLMLRGKCRSCGASISPRYILVESMTGALFAGVAARLGYSGQLPAFLALFAGLVALSCVDIELLILPKRIVYPTGIVVAAAFVADAIATGEWGRLVTAALCAAAWFALFFLLNLASPRILGFGDVRLAPVLGLALGWLGVPYVLLGFFAANLIGAIIGVTLIATKKLARSQPIPYGVFLAAGATLAVFAGPELISWFDSLH